MHKLSATLSVALLAVQAACSGDATSPKVDSRPFSGTYRLATANGVAVPGVIGGDPRFDYWASVMDGSLTFTANDSVVVTTMWVYRRWTGVDTNRMNFTFGIHPLGDSLYLVNAYRTVEGSLALTEKGLRFQYADDPGFWYVFSR